MGRVTTATSRNHLQSRIPIRPLCLKPWFQGLGRFPRAQEAPSSKAGYPLNLLQHPTWPLSPVCSPCSLSLPLPPACTSCQRVVPKVLLQSCASPAPGLSMAPYCQEIRSKLLRGIPRPHLTLLLCEPCPLAKLARPTLLLACLSSRLSSPETSSPKHCVLCPSRLNSSALLLLVPHSRAGCPSLQSLVVLDVHLSFGHSLSSCSPGFPHHIRARELAEDEI